MLPNQGSSGFDCCFRYTKHQKNKSSSKHAYSFGIGFALFSRLVTEKPLYYSTRWASLRMYFDM